MSVKARWRCWILFCLLPHLIFTAELDTSSKRAKQDENEVLIPSLKGIVLIPTVDQMLSEHQLKKVKGIDIILLDLPADPEDLEESLAPFLGQPVTWKGLRQIKRAIARFYEENYYPLVILQVPDQDITDEVLQLVVTESRLGKVEVVGNQKWSHLEQIHNYIRLEPGEPINERIVTGDLNFLNRNPYRQVDAIYEPGHTDETTNLLVLVQDTKPYQVYAGTDNTGLPDTGAQLFYAGLMTGNMFSQGHVLSYQYTTSALKMFRSLQAHTGQYIIPLPNQNLINLFGGYATIKAKASFPTKQSTGYSIQGSFRYGIPLLPTYYLKHELVTGFDYKRTNTALLFNSDTLLAPFQQAVNLTQFMVSYSGSFEQPGYTLIFIAELFFSPFAWLPQQTNTDYNALRPGSQNQWIYGRGAFSYFLQLPLSFYLSLAVRGQASSNALLPSEQFGVGGYDTVRGYKERILNGDDAFLFSGEIHTPTWKIVQKIQKSSLIEDGLQLLAFADLAYSFDITAVPGQPQSDYLAGVGPGLRYYLDPYLACRLDWGIKLHKSTAIGTSLGLVHFSLILNY